MCLLLILSNKLDLNQETRFTIILIIFCAKSTHTFWNYHCIHVPGYRLHTHFTSVTYSCFSRALHSRVNSGWSSSNLITSLITADHLSIAFVLAGSARTHYLTQSYILAQLVSLLLNELCICKLMKWQVDEMASWWNGKLMNWSTTNLITVTPLICSLSLRWLCQTT